MTGTPALPMRFIGATLRVAEYRPKTAAQELGTPTVPANNFVGSRKASDNYVALRGHLAVSPRFRPLQNPESTPFVDQWHDGCSS